MAYTLIDIKSKSEIDDVKALLDQNGLFYEDKVSFTLGFYDQNHLVATGSIYENVIKMIAVDQDYQHQNLTGDILIRLIERLRDLNYQKYFLYTKPSNQKYFLDYAFKIVEKTENIVLFENDVYTIDERLEDMKRKLPNMQGSIASLVMNCNPITNGHLYLIETCAKENDHVLLFLVEENKSVFSFDVRMDLVKNATKHLKNVVVLPSTPYVISSATFPTYFLKELNDQSKAYMELDIAIFKHHFMPIFGIDKRYVGSEPFDQTTHAYNQTMQSILDDHLKLIPRLEKNDYPISASLVRKLAKAKDYDTIKNLVPDATYAFLISDEGQALFHD